MLLCSTVQRKAAGLPFMLIWFMLMNVYFCLNDHQIQTKLPTIKPHLVKFTDSDELHSCPLV